MKFGWGAVTIFLLLGAGSLDAFHIDASDPPAAYGEVTLTGESWTLRAPPQPVASLAAPGYVTPDGRADARVLLRFHAIAPDATVQVEDVTYRFLRVASPTGSPVNGLNHHRDETRRTFSISPDFSVDVACDENCLLFANAHPGEADLHHRFGAHEGLLLKPPSQALSPLETPAGTAYRWTPPAAGSTVHPHARGETRLTGAFGLFLWEANVTLLEGDRSHHFRVGHHEAEDPGFASGAGGPVDEYEVRFLVVHAAGVEAMVERAPEEGVTLTVDDPAYQVDGRLFFETAEGSASYGETSRVLTGKSLEIQGALNVHPRCPSSADAPAASSEDGRCAFVIEGRADQVRVAGHLLLDKPTPATAGLAALGAALLTLLPRALEGLRALLALAHGSVSPSKALSHPIRRRIHAALEGTRALHFSALSRATGIPFGMLTHHLSILQRTSHVRSRTFGRHRFYWLTSRHVSNAELSKLAVLISPRARRCALHVLESPGTTPREIAKAEEIPQNNVNYHLRRLRDVGLVCTEASKAGRPLRYYPEPTLKDILRALPASVCRQSPPHSSPGTEGSNSA